MSQSTSVNGQRKKRPSEKSPSIDQAELVDRLSKSRAEVVKATQEFKASLEKLLAFHEADAKTASEALEKRKELYSQGLISKRELEESERSVSDAQAKIDGVRRQIMEADNLIAEADAAEKLARSAAGAYTSTVALIRYNGFARWTLADASKVESFYLAAFGRPLPVSAFGQSPVHERMGFDHHDAIDVAVYPDSPEGQALMAYLRGAGIPFVAFRYAVAGSATGAHIHIGNPSHRILPSAASR